MPAVATIFLAILAAALAVTAAVYLVVPLFKAIGYLFKGIGWLIAHVFRFVFGMVSDVLRAIGAIITAVIFAPLILINILIGRWSASAHYGRALQQELVSIAHCTYRVVIGHPARFLLLDSLTDGIERRVPEVMAKAPGSDKPSKRAGSFPGYTIIGSLRGGGSGGKLYIAEPSAEKKAAFAREGLPGVGQVVIKNFSIQDGSSLPQIIRESRALEAARNLHLVLDHELTDERFFYVMPYVPGQDLSERTRELHAASGADGLNPPRLREGLGYVIDLLHTLDRYHRGGLWHKDIKPDNIIVHDGTAHLVDLGLVTPLRSAMTLTTHGTEYFRDPELVRLALRGAKVHEVDGVKFDIYGAGAVLYSVVENSFPAHGGLSQITKRCPDALKWVIRRAMTDLNQRYPSARHMLADLTTIAGAPDPLALKPADLPSMKGVDVDSMPPEPAVARAPEPEPEPEPAFVGAAAAAHSPRSDFGPAGADPFADSPPRIKVLDWWTGRYAAEPRYGVARAAHTAPPRRPRNAVPRPAAEQLAAARARVQAARSRAQARKGGRAQAMHARMSRRMRRHERYSNKPNVGVLVSVGALVLLVILVTNGKVNFGGSRASIGFENSLYSGHAAGDPVKLIVHDKDDRLVNLAPRGDWTDAPDEMGVAIKHAADDGYFAEAGYDADRTLDALFADGRTHANLLLIDDLPPSDPNRPENNPKWLIAGLKDAGITVAGLGSEEAEINLLADARTVLGTAVAPDAENIAALREWMSAQKPPIDGVFWLLPNDKWHFIPAHDGNVQTFIDYVNEHR